MGSWVPGAPNPSCHRHIFAFFGFGNVAVLRDCHNFLIQARNAWLLDVVLASEVWKLFHIQSRKRCSKQTNYCAYVVPPGACCRYVDATYPRVSLNFCHCLHGELRVCFFNTNWTFSITHAGLKVYLRKTFGFTERVKGALTSLTLYSRVNQCLASHQRLFVG